MAQNVPSTNGTVFSTLEAAQFKTKLGQQISIGGLMYLQYGSTASIASSTTPTSLFSESATTCQGTRSIPAGGLGWAPGLSYANLPGLVIRGKIAGTVKTSGTPNLTITAGLIQGVASTYTAYSTTGAVAMVSTVTALPFEIDLIFCIRAMGAAATASIFCGGWFRYVSATTVANFFQLPWTVTTATLTTLAAAIVDCQVTWGTSHANNDCIAQFGMLEMLN